MTSALVMLLACTREPIPVVPAAPGAIPLARTTEVVSIEVPATNRERRLPNRVPPRGKLEKTDEGPGWVEYRGAMPFRDVYLGHSASRQPRGLTLALESKQALRYGYDKRPWQWRALRHHFWVRVAPGKPLELADLSLRYDAAWQVEMERNHDTAGRDDSAFVFRTEEIGDDTVRGVYVPAPGEVTWKVTVPENAALRARVHLLLPEVHEDMRSDGATAGARLSLADGTVGAEASCTLEPGRSCDLDLDVTGLAGHDVTLSLYSEPGGDRWLDYVFFEDPILATRVEHPRQVVLVFVDTLRPDRLGLYGYSKETPAIDAFGASGVVFDNARTVSSWTLPATRATLTGRQPEEWGDATTLAAHLSRRGWATTAYVTNAFLSRPFGMGRDWDTYRYIFLNPAAKQVDQSIEQLARHPDRNQLLLVHFMEPHLPYQEPEEYGLKYAGPPPDGVPYRFGLLEMGAFRDDAERQTYMSNRYDSSVRYMDDNLARLFAALDDDAIVVFYSDHGEEFWEHGGIEHGHAVWDEVLKVPLILHAPGLDPKRVAEPVSVMDVAPTLYDLLGIDPPEALDGHSLVPLARGEASAAAEFRDRRMVFGRTLRDRDAWGLVHGDRKVVTTNGEVMAFDLGADPGEKVPAHLTSEELVRVRDELSAGLGRPFAPTLRIRGPGTDKMWSISEPELTVTLDSPVRAAWLGHNAPDHPPETRGDTVVWRSKNGLANEMYILPEVALTELKRVEVRLKGDGGEYVAVWPDQAEKDVWLRFGPDGKQAVLGVELAPLPPAVEVPTTSEEMEDELRILGYVED